MTNTSKLIWKKNAQRKCLTLRLNAILPGVPDAAQGKLFGLCPFFWHIACLVILRLGRSQLGSKMPPFLGEFGSNSFLGAS